VSSGKLIARTRLAYYIANVAGIFAILGLLVWLLRSALTGSGINLGSIYLWLAVLPLILLPYTFIGFFSSMKSVEVTGKTLTISYVFQKHQNIIAFTDIKEIQTTAKSRKEGKRPMRDTFRLTLTDGRVFEFDRAQLDQYDKLKAFCQKRVQLKSM